MLRLNLKPYIFKFLFEGYPGANALLLRREVRIRRARALSTLAESPAVKETVTKEEAFALIKGEATHPPGLTPIITNQYQADSFHKMSLGNEDKSKNVSELYDETAQVPPPVRPSTLGISP